MAPAVAGVLWLFLLNPTLGILTHLLRALGVDWNYLLNGDQALMLIVDRRRVEADQLQLPVLPRRPAGDPEVADRGRGHRRRRPGARFWTIVFPLLSPTAFFLLVVNIVYAFFDTFAIVDASTQGGPGQATTILVSRSTRTGSRP